MDLPQIEGGWEVIYADPPWAFASNSAAKPGRSARRHYATMPFAEIVALPIRKIVARQALLLMWITVPFEHRANEVIEAWGFKAVSRLVWDKGQHGTGYWAMNQHEPCIIAKRGKFPCPKPALLPTSIIPGARREHSRKPDWISEIIDARLPEARKLELFARRPREGWTVWGNETGKFA
ncbi:MT-A70 family methyltransferase [Paracoccus sp. (in: a-proteobacteria)]|uniref:MT-A70 family methyltransferase n=1 Tax=Paracoccus sp. TaxID=267 RepID=UPI0028AEC006|nr:MT-A70 family methyltransferase [Paracoccus sp. (in: a-proteobacteria)]